MPNVASMARQAVRGVPCLQKEMARRVSLSTGKVFSTPMTYYVIFSGHCILECAFCSIYKQVDPILAPETMLRIVREAKDLSGTGFNISLSGGEPIGNIYKNSLSEIYYGGTAGTQRKIMIHCNIDCQQTCKRPIPLWVKARAFLPMG